MFPTKFITMRCPECDGELSNAIACINTPTNSVDIMEVENMDFECTQCRITIGLMIDTHIERG